MKPYDTMCQIRHQQVCPAASNNNGGGVAWQPVAPGGSALAVPDDPVDSALQRFRTENGFAVDASGCGCAWFRDFCDGNVVDMSTYNAVDFLEMLLDLPDTAVLGAEAAETPARAEAVAVPDRPVEMSRLPLSSLSESDSSSDDDDDPWLPAKSKKRGGTKRRRQQQQRPPAGQAKQQLPVSTALPAPRSVAVAVEGGRGSGNERWCRHCGTAETTLWRAGPEGPKTLCNACGLRHKNKSAAPTTKRRPPAKPSCAKSKNYSVLPLVGVSGMRRW